MEDDFCLWLKRQIPFCFTNWKGERVGKRSKFHFLLSMQINCCSHRSQNNRGKQHKKASNNGNGCLINIIVLSGWEPCWKVIVSQNIFIFRGLEQHLSLIFHCQCQKINDLKQMYVSGTHFQAALLQQMPCINNIQLWQEMWFRFLEKHKS